MSDGTNNITPQASYGFDPTYGFSLEQLLSVEAPPEPKDFTAFWEKRYQHALTIAPMPVIQSTDLTHPDWLVFTIQYTSTEHFIIRGWLLLPKHTAIERGFIIGHGYGGRDGLTFTCLLTMLRCYFPAFAA